LIGIFEYFPDFVPFLNEIPLQGGCESVTDHNVFASTYPNGLLKQR